jgi:twitching motility protein PilT
MHLNDVLVQMIKRDASDVHITAETHLSFTIKQNIVSHKMDEGYENFVDETSAQVILEELTKTKSTISALYTPEEQDGGYMFTPHEGDKDYFFRYNVALSMGRIHITIRKLIDEILTLEQIQMNKGAPLSFYKEVMKCEEGLYLVVGSTGSGKSTTLATLIDEVLKKHALKMISLESPIEFYFKDEAYENSIIIQREVELDTKDFASGIRAAMRQNPKVIFVGEIRDPETAMASLQAANSGHTVFATLHANSPEKALDRIKFLVGEITNDFSFIKAIMYQRLINIKGKITPKREVQFDFSEDEF